MALTTQLIVQQRVLESDGILFTPTVESVASFELHDLHDAGSDGRAMGTRNENPLARGNDGEPERGVG